MRNPRSVPAPAAGDRPGARRRSLLFGAVLLGAALALGLPTLPFGFVWDDPYVLTLNPAVKGPLSLEAFTRSTLVLSNGPTPFFRPLQLLSHALEYRAFGDRPSFYHLVNALLHAANVLLVFVLARGLGAGPVGALAGALLFAVHPLHAEPVAFVSSRGDLFAALFALAAAILVLRTMRGPAPPARRRALEAGLIAVLVAAAALSKESAILLALALAALPLLQNGEPDGARARAARAWPVWAAAAAALALYGLVRAGVGFAVAPTLSAEADPGGALRRLAHYALLLAFPLGNQVLFPPRPPAWGWGSLAGLALLALAAGVAPLLYRRRRVALFLVAWFLLGIAPVLRLYPFAGPDLSARYAYVPSVALSLALALAWPAPGRSSAGRATAAVGLAAFGVLAALWYREILSWRDNLSLYSRMAREEPSFAGARFNLGNALSARGRASEAIREYRAAIELDPGYMSARINLMNALAMSGRPAEAIASGHEALGGGRDHPMLRYNMGRLYAESGRNAEAVEHYREAVRGDPDYVEARFNLANLLAKGGRRREAIVELQALLARAPDFALAHYALGFYLVEEGDAERGSRHLRRYVELSPEGREAPYARQLLSTIRAGR